jgi:SprT protein
MNLEQAQIIAERLMQQHGLIEKGWRFEWDSAPSRAGCCNHGKKVISLSKRVSEINPRTHVVDTMLHEIAHALVGRRPRPHGVAWKNQARAIGCTASVTCTAETRTTLHLWTGNCPKCGNTVERYVRRHMSCGRCSKKFDPRFVFQWVRSKKRLTAGMIIKPSTQTRKTVESVQLSLPFEEEA